MLISFLVFVAFWLGVGWLITFAGLSLPVAFVVMSVIHVVIVFTFFR